MTLQLQSVWVQPQITQGRYFVFCTLDQREGEWDRFEYLKQCMEREPKRLYSAYNSSPLQLEIDEIARARSVACLVEDMEEVFYEPVVIALPLDVVEESPHLSILIDTVTANAVQYFVFSSIPNYLWCSVFRSEEPQPCIRELKRKTPVFAREKQRMRIDGLTPNTNYSLYCYAESVHGSPMKDLLWSVRTTFVTNEGTCIPIP